MRASRTVTVALVALAAMEGPAAGQGVAFEPVVSAFPNGVGLSTTPSISFDRRYVRMGVNPMFTGLEGFDTYSVPAAVTGGGFRSAGMNGLNVPAYGYGGGYGPTYGPVASPSVTAFLAGAAGPLPPPRLSRVSGDLPRQAVARGASRTRPKTKPRRTR